MNRILGHDCDQNEIEEFDILRAIWSNDIDIEDLPDADPRMYCAVVAKDGKAYAISVYEHDVEKYIRERENIPEGEPIPTVIKPISEMKDYELAIHNTYGDNFGKLYYAFDRDKLKARLNRLLEKEKREKGPQKAKKLPKPKSNQQKNQT